MRILLLAMALATVQAVWLNTNNETTIKEATAQIVEGLLNYYEGTKYGGTVGMFSAPYYWWEAGGAIGSLVDYSFYMQDHQYDDLIMAALTHQAGQDYNYVPLNQSTTEGNDDQAFWGFAVIAAAEKNFTNPLDPKLAWLSLAQGVFNTMMSRWDEDTCKGGLRWQIFQWNSGYNYKNSVSNGALFHLAARLARYTANDTYLEWAEKVYDWMHGVDLIDEETWFVYDGVFVDNNCSNVTKWQWSYNQGLLLGGSAVLYNYTRDEKWRTRTLKFLNTSSNFFYHKPDAIIMYEAACQNPTNSEFTCNNDQRTFKAYFSRFLGLTSVMLPETYDTIHHWLVDSSNAAAYSCSGGTDGHTCGLAWTNGSWDGVFGLGEQMSALEVMQNLVVAERPAPLTADDGGTSLGNPAAGFAQASTTTSPLDISGGDKAGASIITAVVGAAILGTGAWLLI